MARGMNKAMIIGYVGGELRTRTWEHANGAGQLRAELVANEMIMLGPRAESQWNRDESPI